MHIGDQHIRADDKRLAIGNRDLRRIIAETRGGFIIGQWRKQFSD
jgi:hypothetical protein